MTEPTEVRVPKLNNNDTSYVLTEWLADDGQWCEPGDPVAVVETAKAAEELCCEAAGVLHRAVPETSDCACGDVIGRLFADEQDRQEFLAARVPAADPPPGNGAGPVLTAPARRLADELGIGADALAALGPGLVREADVRRIAGDGDTDRTFVPSRNQRAVAAVVTESHRTIPAAFTVLAVDVTAALRVEDAGPLPHGLPELLIAAVGRLCDRFPLFFATPAEDGTARLPDGAHVGVTVDTGNGLYVPVIRDAGHRALPDIARTLMDYRIRALRGDFREHDLTGGNIVVALNNDEGVVFAQPVVFPGQICAVALPDARAELVLGTDGAVTTRSVAHVGLAYDHRFVNGRAAVDFLQALRAELVVPENLRTADV